MRSSASDVLVLLVKAERQMMDMARVSHSWEPDGALKDADIDPIITLGEVDAATCGTTGLEMFTGEAGAAAGAAVAQHLTMLDGGNSGVSRPAAPRQACWQLYVSVNELLEPCGASANARTHCPSTVPYAVSVRLPLHTAALAMSEAQDDDRGLSHLVCFEKHRTVCGLSCLARGHATRDRLTRAPILTFCLLSCILSARGAARCSSAFGVELFAYGPRSRSTLAHAQPAVRQRASVCAARSSCLRACRPAVLWLDWPWLVRSQGRHSALPLTQRLPPAASGAWAANYERKCGPRARDARLWSARAARPRRSCSSHIRALSTRASSAQ